MLGIVDAIGLEANTHDPAFFECLSFGLRDSEGQIQNRVTSAVARKQI